MEALAAFGAGLVAFRLAGRLAARWRARRAPELAAWAAALVAYAVACGALAWGAAAGWEGRVFRVYYVFGGLLAAPLLGAGSLLRARWGRRVPAVTLLYVGLALGIGISVPLTDPVGGGGIPAAQDHLAYFPGRVLAIAANSFGTLAVAAVALATFRRRPLGNGLILAGVATAAVGSSLPRLGEAGTALLLTLGALLLFAGFVAPRSLQSAQSSLTLRQSSRLTP
jgi:hypothetical protein